MIIVSNGTHYSVYTNGTLQYSTAISITPYYSSNRSIIIGQSGFEGSSHNAYVGKIDEFTIYARALSIDQLKTLTYGGSDTFVANQTYDEEQWNACITPND